MRFFSAFAVLAVSLPPASGFTTPPPPHALRPLPSSPPCPPPSSLSSRRRPSSVLLRASYVPLPSPPPLPPGASSDLTLYFLRSLIDALVPAAAALIVLAFASKVFGRASGGGAGAGGPRQQQGDDDGQQLDYYQRFFEQDREGEAPGRGGSIRGLLSGLRRGGEGPRLGPKDQFLRVTKLNDRYESYDFSLTSAVDSRPKALLDYRKRGVADVVERALSSYGGKVLLPQDACEELVKAERSLLSRGSDLLSDLSAAKLKLGELVAEDIKEMIGEYKVDEEEAGSGPALGDVVVGGPSAEAKASSDKNGNANHASGGALAGLNPLKGMMKAKRSDALTKKVGDIEASIAGLEVEFVRDVSEVVAHAAAELNVVSTADAVVAQNLAKFLLRAQLEGGTGGILEDVRKRPLERLFGEGAGGEGAKVGRRRSLFVVDFPGDVGASQVQFLREEVSAIVRQAKGGDEALVVLQSGGGTVTGYGLAAAQLVRLRKKGVKLTIAVEQVAASGGYMMACTGDKIVASPFAVLGSIGVISDQPNVYERLKREGIEFSTVTAGKFKRTLTPTKKPTKEDFDKSKEDVEQILVLFKDFVSKNRPSLDIDKVATGETWFGEDALELGLCDELKTKDEVILDYIRDDFDAYMLEYDPDMDAGPGSLSLLPGVAARARDGRRGLRGRLSGFLGGVVRDVIREEFGAGGGDEGGGLERKYIARDTSHEGYRM